MPYRRHRVTDHDLQNQTEAAADTSNAAVTNPGRRRFAQAGGAILPAILSLSARPTWATGGVQCLSARMSGNLSSPTTYACNFGKAPTFWAQNPHSWPSPWHYGRLRRGRTPGSTNPADYKGGTRYGHLYPDCVTSVKDVFLRNLFNNSGNDVEKSFAAALLSAFADASGYSPKADWLRRVHADPSHYRLGASHQEICVTIILPTFA
jgi:hypothetical protein